MASNLKKKFEQAAADSANPTRSKAAAEWDGEPAKPAPATRTADGKPSAGGLKAKFELLANPPPPKKTMGKVKWQDDRDQGAKKRHVPGNDPTKPPPPKSIADLP
eukprot:TRINITY_DN1507_c0_g1_i1.p3 TRINITY_DN1507_c0_g1~~TRINITY_DN1507_c0_g1_i1.p3  ORF type:complete len:119 (+),score=21.19 TRINITY_DN1507_c0_g1_i1:43-357(+)